MEMALLMENESLIQTFQEFHDTCNETKLLLDEITSLDNNPVDVELTEKTCNEEESKTFVYARSKGQGFPVAVVGDVGTCKVNRGVKQKDHSASHIVGVLKYLVTCMQKDFSAKQHLKLIQRVDFIKLSKL